MSLGRGEHERVASRGTQNIDAFLLRKRGLAEGLKFNKEGMLKARELFGEAIDVDPTFARAWAGLSWTYWHEALMGGWTLSRDEALEKAFEYAQHAVDVDPNDPSGYQYLGSCMSLKGNYDQAISYCKKAVDLAPNDFQANGHLGMTLMWAEQPKQGLEYLERAKRLSPRYPAWVDVMTGFAQLMAGLNEEAVVSLRQGVDRSPKAPLLRGRLIAALVAAGQVDEAKAEAERLLKDIKDFNISSYVKTHRFKDPARFEWLRGLLLQAGLPENPPLQLPDKPSIAVLPFKNLSGESEQEYLTDGITESIIGTISRVSGLFVIASSSVFTYKGKAVKVQTVSKELGG